MKHFKFIPYLVICIMIFLPGQLQAQNDFYTNKGPWFNTKTAQHMELAESHVFIIPPKGFTKNRNAFIAGDSAFIMAEDIRPKGMQANVADYTIDSFALSKDRPETFISFTIQGYPARMVSFHKFHSLYVRLIFGDSSFFMFVQAQIPEHNREMEYDICHALQSLYYESNKATDPYDKLSFRLHDEHMRFRLYSVNAAMVMLTENGQPLKDARQPFIMAYSDDKLPSAIAEKIRLMNESLGKGISDIKKQEASDTAYGKIAVHSERWTGYFTKLNCQAYWQISIITIGDRDVIMAGFTPRDDPEFFATCNRLSATIELNKN